ncbi:MAG: HD-GYP domain-containing protein [Planctomycetaceae bacterium]|nr:MAG: HD-GYP domain-containing protein [Planctomycetaceae bacterium]
MNAATKNDLKTLFDEQTSLLSETKRRLNVEIESRIKAEEALQKNEESFRTIIDGNVDGIVVLDKNGFVRFANPAAELFFGRKAENLIGKPFGYPVIADETTELDILRGKEGLITVEMRVVETKWEGEKVNLASLRNISDRKEMEEKLKDSLERTRKILGGTIMTVSMMVEIRDPYTAGHQHRVADLARSIATEMNLSNQAIEGIRISGSIHDVGKISIPAEILNKPGQLSKEEIRMIKTHPQVGYDILKTIDFPYPVAKFVLQHHERIDGSGYPAGLSGKDITKEAKLLAVADVVEAMSSHRPYRPSLGINKALEEISKNRGVLYDAGAVDACLKLFSEKGYKLSAI